MSQAAIDTLRFAHRLKEAGVDPGQAEAMARALGDELADQLATKTSTYFTRRLTVRPVS